MRLFSEENDKRKGRVGHKKLYFGESSRASFKCKSHNWVNCAEDFLCQEASLKSLLNYVQNEEKAQKEKK